MDEMQSKKWVGLTIGSVCMLLIITMFITIWVDPYFHYHAPFEGFYYQLSEQRYINDGIGRHFDYNAIITGSSMVENFRTSDFNELFSVKSVKMPYSGAAYQEVSQNLQRALKRNKDVRVVLWCLDYNGLTREYDEQEYDSLPEYLYDDNILNDVSYWFNKDIFYHGTLKNLFFTLKGYEPDSMDAYAMWSHETGMNHILLSYTPEQKIQPQKESLSDWKVDTVRKTVEENILAVTREYPDVTFYIYFSPYSIVYWDEQYRQGIAGTQIEAEKIASEMLIGERNIKLFNFYENTDMICDLSYYNDRFHYSAEINKNILEWISKDEYRITKENLAHHIESMKQFYLNYSYSELYE